MNTKICIICSREFIPTNIRNTRCPTCRRKQSDNQRAQARERQQAYRFKSRYGISLSDYKELDIEQAGKCKLCSAFCLELIPYKIDRLRLICTKCKIIVDYADLHIDVLTNYLKHKK